MEEHKISPADRTISVKTIFRLSDGGGQGEVRVSKEDWSILTQINGARTVGEIARRLHADDAELLTAFLRLSEAGLVEVCEHPDVATRPLVDAAILKQIQATFTRFMGPVAPVLMEEAIEGLGEDATAFPRHELSTLMEVLAGQITDETKRVHFQKAMLDLLKRA